MFNNATTFNQPLGTWNVSKVTYANLMFAGATSFNQDLSAWDISLISSAINMLKPTALSTQNYDKILIAWDALALKPSVSF